MAHYRTVRIQALWHTIISQKGTIVDVFVMFRIRNCSDAVVHHETGVFKSRIVLKAMSEAVFLYETI
jgi:hypothetical protein